MKYILQILLNPIFSLLVGSFITIFVARLYYVAASKDLLLETKRLRELSELTLRALEAGDIYKLARDTDGTIVGLTHTGSGAIQAQPAGVAGSVNVESKNEKN